MSRVSSLLKLPSHPMIGKLFLKLSQKELALVTDFVKKNANLSNDDYMEKANRWYLDQPKPTHYTDMWAIVISCKE